MSDNNCPICDERVNAADCEHSRKAATEFEEDQRMRGILRDEKKRRTNMASMELQTNLLGRRVKMHKAEHTESRPYILSTLEELSEKEGEIVNVFLETEDGKTTVVYTVIFEDGLSMNVKPTWFKFLPKEK